MQETYRGMTIHVRPMDGAETPRSSDCNYCKFVFFHKRYNLPKEVDINSDWFDNRDEMETYLQGDRHETHQEKNEDLGGLPEYKFDYVAPVSMYDHSGLAFRMGRHRDWDSGQVGFICANFNEEFTTIEAIDKLAKAELGEYDRRQRGDIYEFEIEELEEFSGYYDDEDGALMDAKQTIDTYLEREGLATYKKYDVYEDLANIKKQIKSWEQKLDTIVNQEESASRKIPLSRSQLDELEQILHEMCAINI